MPIPVPIAMPISMVSDVHLVLHPNTDSPCNHHCVHYGLEASFLDVLLITVHPTCDIGNICDSAEEACEESGGGEESTGRMKVSSSFGGEGGGVRFLVRTSKTRGNWHMKI